MSWLDSVMPKDIGKNINGTMRGSCPTGVTTEQVNKANENAFVIFSDIQVNPLNEASSGSYPEPSLNSALATATAASPSSATATAASPSTPASVAAASHKNKCHTKK